MDFTLKKVILLCNLYIHIAYVSMDRIHLFRYEIFCKDFSLSSSNSVTVNLFFLFK